MKVIPNVGFPKVLAIGAVVGATVVSAAQDLVEQETTAVGGHYASFDLAKLAALASLALVPVVADAANQFMMICTYGDKSFKVPLDSLERGIAAQTKGYFSGEITCEPETLQMLEMI